MTNNKGLTFMPIGGMCNRLIAMISAIKTCRENQIPLTILWWKTACVGFSDINQYFIFPSEVKVIIPSFEECSQLYHSSCRRMNIIDLNKCRSPFGYGMSCDRFLILPTETYYDGFKRFLSGEVLEVLKVKPQILTELKDYISKVKKLTGVHIRAYEIDYTGKIQNPREQKMLNAITKAFEDKIFKIKDFFFLASDSQYIFDYFIQRYPKCIHYPHDKYLYDSNGFLPRGTIPSFELGLKEWIILSHCQNIIGSSQSSYSFLAAIRTRRLSIIGVMNPIETWLNLKL